MFLRMLFIVLLLLLFPHTLIRSELGEKHEVLCHVFVGVKGLIELCCYIQKGLFQCLNLPLMVQSSLWL